MSETPQNHHCCNQALKNSFKLLYLYLSLWDSFFYFWFSVCLSVFLARRFCKIIWNRKLWTAEIGWWWAIKEWHRRRRTRLKGPIRCTGKESTGRLWGFTRKPFPWPRLSPRRSPSTATELLVFWSFTISTRFSFSLLVSFLILIAVFFSHFYCCFFY